MCAVQNTANSRPRFAGLITRAITGTIAGAIARAITPALFTGRGPVFRGHFSRGRRGRSPGRSVYASIRRYGTSAADRPMKRRSD
jgi:hypothetical protein